MSTFEKTPKCWQNPLFLSFNDKVVKPSQWNKSEGETDRVMETDR